MPMRPHDHDSSPSDLVRAWLPRIPRGRALDVAMGEGRHALLLATEGFDVIGIDRDASAVTRVKADAVARGLPIDARVLDLEEQGISSLLGNEPTADHGGSGRVAPGKRFSNARSARAGSFTRPFMLIVNVNYLQRDLIPDLKAALAPGGWILFETFTTEHPRVSRAGAPSNPDFLLKPGELRRAFEDLMIACYEEGVFPARNGDRKALARLAAFRPMDPNQEGSRGPANSESTRAG